MNANRVSIGNVIAAAVCTGLLGTVVLPALDQVKQRIEPVLCANNLRGCNQAWNVYAQVNADTWMHHWDRSAAATALTGNSTSLQAPFTMWYYTKGEIPPGAAYSPNGWWNPATQSYGNTGPYFNGLVEVPSRDPYKSVPANTVYHCPTVARLGYRANLIWHPYTSYSLAILIKNYGTDENPAWYTALGQDFFYPKPSLFTHAATTLQLADMGGIATEGLPNAWCSYNIRFQGQHGGKANNVFADGHVELLTLEEFQAKGEEMFRPYAAPPAGGQASE